MPIWRNMEYIDRMYEISLSANHHFNNPDLILWELLP